MFKDGHYVDSGLSLAEIEKQINDLEEENKKYKTWDDVPKTTEDQND